MKPTPISEQLYQYFQQGGAPLTAKEICAMFDLGAGGANQVLRRLRRAAKWIPEVDYHTDENNRERVRLTGLAKASPEECAKQRRPVSNVKTNTYTYKLYQHFLSGGGPLTSAQVATTLGLTDTQASRLLTNAITSPVWQVDYVEVYGDNGGLVRRIRDIYPATHDRRASTADIRAYILAHPDATPHSVACALSCGDKAAVLVRQQLIQSGELTPTPRHQPGQATDAPTKTPQDDWVVPTRHHVEDIPHMLAAVAIRNLWPAPPSLR